MSEAGSRLRKLDAITSTAVRFAIFCVWPTVVAIALGATLFAATHADLLPAMFENRLTRDQRLVGLGYFAVSLVAVAAFYVVVLRYRYREHWPPGFDRARRLHPYLSFVLSGPAIVALTELEIATRHQWLTWLYIALAVLAWWPTFRALSSRRPTQRRQPILSTRQRDILSLGLVLVLWAAYAYFFTNLSIINHHAFHTKTVDLGLYNNIFFQSSHGRPLGCTFLRGGTHASAHFDPILVVLSPLYRFLWPRAEFLLTLQAVWCGAGVVAAYLIGRDQLGSRAFGLVWAAVYALHPALHGANLYEFHSLTLLFSPLLFAVYFLLSGKLRLYFVTLPLLLLIREDVSLLMCFVGLYGVISEKPGLKAAGWITLLVSLAYFVIAKAVFMPSPGLFNQGPGYSYAYYYKEMIPNKLGELDFVTTLLTNPAFLVELVAKEKKVQYLLVIFFPLLFLPAFAGRARVMLLYGLIFMFLASKSAVYSSHFQYSAVLLPVAIALAPVGLRRLQQARPKDRSLATVVMGCVLVASLLVSWKYGAILENSSFRGGYSRVRWSLTEEMEARYDSFAELISQIEPDASVSVTDRVGAHVTNRLEVYHLSQDIDTDYLLVDSKDLRGRNKASLKRREDAGKVELLQRFERWSLYRAVTPPKTQ
jgi:uncharacterized membrane protein